MLQVIFGDDEHTSAEGPYSRLMRTRKWLYVLAIVAIALSNGLYDEVAAAALLRVIEVPEALLSKAVLLGLAYLVLQYGILVAQLLSAYDIVLVVRFEDQRKAELSAATDAVVEARRRLVAARAAASGQADGAHAVSQAQLELESARAARLRLLSMNYARRPLYRRLEVIIDLLRVLVPPVLGGIGLWTLAR